MRRVFGPSVALSIGLVLVPPSPSAAAPLEGPNVLLITIDDLRPELSIYGSPAVSSPSFERLSARALQFDRAYAQGTNCNPSRTSLLLGLRPHTTGVGTNRVFFRDAVPDAITLPQFFRQNGYTTASVGRVFHGAQNKGWQDPPSWDRVLVPEGVTPLGRRGKGRTIRAGDEVIARWRAAKGGDDDQPDGQIASQAVRLLEELGAGGPFFAAIGFNRPHTPYVAPERYFELYRLKSIRPPRPSEFEGSILAVALPKKPFFARLTVRQRRELIRGYLASTSFVDAQLGRILDAVDRLSLWSDTVIVVTSDHGYHLGEHGHWGKRTLFEHSARVPLLIHAPSMKTGGRTSSRTVELLDLYPTLSDLAGLEPRAPLEGRSLVPLLNRPGRSWKPAAYTELVRDDVIGRSVRTGRWRYTKWGDGSAGVELYDHRIDPDEHLNLALVPEFEDVIRRLDDLLEEGFEPN